MNKEEDKVYIFFKEITNYLIVGILTTTVSLITFFIFINVFFKEKNPQTIQIANGISWFCSVIFAYYTSKKFVFESSKKNKLKEIIEFILSRSLTLVLEIVLIYLMVQFLTSNEYSCKFASQALALITNYWSSKILVFNGND